MLRILLMPLLSSIFCGFFGRHLGHTGSMIISCSLITYTFYLSCQAFYEIGLGGVTKYMAVSKWIESGLFQCDWSFSFDTLTVVMLVVITSISSVVHLYSTGYMKEDPHVPRFMSYLSLFTFFMILLVTGDNFMVLFVGWEGVGLCSYLLINFWWTRLQANKAALKAMILNRIGDFGLAIGIFSAFYSFRAVDYDLLFSLVNCYDGKTFFFIYDQFPMIDTVCLFLFLGAMGKSAQLGLHMWLPDAMEGPTPVSALIHAATMVTAGVFLITRCSPFFEYSPTALSVITVIGAATAFFASTVALVQNDLKKVIAYSTCSQLGYMIFACGVSNYAAGIFHLTNHAFFKALLFLSAGSVIHAMGDEQDMRRMGGLKTLLPYTYSMFFVGNLALMGFPFLAGFYSKDLILESAYATYSLSGFFAYLLGTTAAFLTSFYSTRLLSLVFLTEPNSYKKVMENVHESPFVMAFPLGLLAILSVFSGYFLKDMFVGFGTDFWGNSIFVHPKHFILMDAEFIPSAPKQMVLLASLYGAFTAYYLNTFFFALLYDWKMSPRGVRLYNFLNRKWFFDKLMNDFLSQTVMRTSYITTYKILDKGYFEFFGPFGISHTLYDYMGKIKEFSTSLIYHSSFIILVGATILTLMLTSPTFFQIQIGIVLFLSLVFEEETREMVDFPEEEKPFDQRRRYGDEWTYF